MVKFKGKEIQKEDVIKEVEKFRQRYKDTNEYKNWIGQGAYKYAIEYEGEIYPPKYILSKVTGIDLSEFSGGKAISDIFEKLGFLVKEKKYNTKYWKIAPGEEARFWGRCLRDRNIAVGWDEMANLSKYINNYDNFKEYFQSVYKGENTPQQLAKKQNELWSFLNLKEDDILIANKGLTSILGIGKVVGTYEYREDYKEYKHTVPVLWFDTEEKPIPMEVKSISDSWFGFTIRELSFSDFKKLTGSDVSIEEDLYNWVNNTLNLCKIKKQIILYGPPGTGKTFNTKSISLNLLDKGVSDFISGTSNETFSIESEKDFNNKNFIEIQKMLETLPIEKKEVGKSMIGYYTISKKTNNSNGLTWLEYPNKKTGFYKVHLRKEIDTEYPETLTSKLTNYKRNGWGGYPEIIIKNTDDVEVTKSLINFAYKNF